LGWNKEDGTSTVKTMDEVKETSAGKHHIMALKSDGSV
jgi:hypothetical protein